MTKITKFDKTNLRALRPEIDAALAEIGAKYGLKLAIGNIRFGDTEFTTKLTVQVDSDGTGGTLTREDSLAADFKKYVNISWDLKDFNESDLGREFRFGGDVYTLVGYKPRARKNSIVGSTVRGRLFVFTPEDVARPWL